MLIVNNAEWTILRNYKIILVYIDPIMLTRNKHTTERAMGTKTENSKLSCSAPDEKRLPIKTDEIRCSNAGETTNEEKLTLILNKLNDVCVDIQGIKISMNKIEDRISNLTERMDNIAQTVEQHSKDILLTNFAIDALEQYTRRNNLRFFGLEELPSENVDNIIIQLIKDKLNIDLNIIDIERAHRIGKKTATKTRPVIVKFASYRTRALVFHARKALKGLKIFIQEDLTKYRHDLMKRATGIFGYGKAWSRDGRIFWIEANETGEAKCTREISELEAYLRRVEAQKIR